MKKVYKTKEPYNVRKIGREKKLYYTADGEKIFFLWNGRRYHMNNVLRLTYPVFYEDADGKEGAIGGYIGICNTYGVLVEIVEGCEDVQLWEEVRDYEQNNISTF